MKNIIILFYYYNFVWYWWLTLMMGHPALAFKSIITLQRFIHNYFFVFFPISIQFSISIFFTLTIPTYVYILTFQKQLTIGMFLKNIISYLIIYCWEFRQLKLSLSPLTKKAIQLLIG